MIASAVAALKLSMFPFVLAHAMLAAPVGTPEPRPSDEQWPMLKVALIDVAINQELMDPRESRYIFTVQGDLDVDLDTIRRRREAIEDAPAVAASVMFPDRSLVNEMCRFNRAYRKELVTRMEWELDRQAEIKRAIEETDLLYLFWDKARDARCEFYYVPVRRAALREALAMLRDEHGQIGEFPPVVPTWRFEEIK